LDYLVPLARVAVLAVLLRAVSTLAQGPVLAAVSTQVVLQEASSGTAEHSAQGPVGRWVLAMDSMSAADCLVWMFQVRR
jgi:hypothetical protein